MSKDDSEYTSEPVPVEPEQFIAEQVYIEESAPAEKVVEEIVTETIPEKTVPTVEPPVLLNQNIEMSSACKGEIKNPSSNLDDYVDILKVSLPEFKYQIGMYPNLKVATGPQGERWAHSINNALGHMYENKTFDASLGKSDAQWKQYMDADGEKLAAGRPKFSPNNDGGILTGERAIIKASAVLGLGALVQIPLWHTGIWISLKAPSDSALLELERRISEEKVKLGRMTNGIVFSNSMVYINSYLINFILTHVYDCSVADITPDSLKKIIKVTDLPTLVWGIICTIYPKGYPFAQPCINNPESCQHVTQELLNVGKLSWTDNKALSAWQRKLMTRRRVRFSDEELLRYQDEHRYGRPEIKDVHPALKIRLNVPTLAQYEDSGFSWVAAIEGMLTDSFATSLRGEERNTYMAEQSVMTRLRQYGHWVDKIILVEDDDKEEVIEDRETIEDLMATFSANEDISNSILNAITDYIDSATISLIAIPKYSCPSCGVEQVAEGNHHEHLIPLDVTRIFFTLQRQRLSKVFQRTIG